MRRSVDQASTARKKTGAELLGGVTAPINLEMAALLNMSLGGLYTAARRGDVPVTKIGSKVLILCAPLREKLGIPHPKVAA